MTFAGTLTATTVEGPAANVDGMVTSVTVTDGVTVNAGDTLYTVDLRPVTAAAGSVPAFRDMSEGLTGADVAQLRGFLCEGSYLKECRGKSLATATPALVAAVKRWQRAQGVEEDGVVRAHDIVWFPQLPVAVHVTPDLVVGHRMTAGTRPLVVVSGVPRLRVPVTEAQAALVPTGSVVRIGESTTGVVVGVLPATGSDNEPGDGLELQLAAADGTSPICLASPDCVALLGNATSVTTEVTVQVVPHRSGIGAPLIAIQTRGDGTTYVVRPDGSVSDVQVVASSNGIALVDGLDAGDKILASPGADG